MKMPLESAVEGELQQSVGPGARLRKEREAQDQSLDKVAAQMHLTEKMLETLEKDDYDNLPSMVFVRGYVKNYARLLGLAEDALVDDLRHVYPNHEELKLNVSTASKKPEIRSSHGLVRVITWLILLFSIGMAVAWWWNYSEAKLADIEAQSVSQESTIVSPEVEKEKIIEPEPLLQTTLPQSSVEEKVPESVVENAGPAISEPVELIDAEPAASVASAVAEPEPEEQVIETLPVKASVSEPELLKVENTLGAKLSFKRSCWVDVRDKQTGYRLIGNFSSGDKLLQGKGPFKVIIGNVNAVTLMVNGKEYNLRQHTNNGNVARFVLDLNEA